MKWEEVSVVCEEARMSIAPIVSGREAAHQDDVYAITVDGPLATEGARRLGRELFAVGREQCTWEELAKRFRRIELDLDGTISIDSVGLGILAAILKRCRDANAECQLCIVRASENASRLLHITRFDQVFSA